MPGFIGVNHDLRRNNGRTIYMPAWFQGETGWGNLAMPNVYKADSSRLYPAGTKYQDGERIFYYGKFIGTVTGTEWIVALQAPNSTGLTLEQGKFLNTHCFQEDMSDALHVRHTADELSLVLNTTPSVMQADNYWSGGWVNGKDTGDSNRPFYRYITKHDYFSTGSRTQQIWNVANEAYTEVDLSAYTDASVLELDQAIITSKTTLPIMVMPNPWKHLIHKVHSEANQFAPFMGAVVPNVVPQNYFPWLQTWGPMGIPHGLAEFGGALTGEIMQKIGGDGSMSPAHSGAPDPADGSTWQVAGHSMGSSIMETASGIDQDLVMVYLMIRR